MANATRLTLKEILRRSLQATKEYVDKVAVELSASQIKMVYLTQEQYDNLTEIDSKTLYIIE